MEIAIIVILFLVGTVVSAIQALKYFERRGKPKSKAKPGNNSSSDPPPT